MEIELNFDLGQHFLIDKKVLEKEIAISDLSKEDKVIEIGAGKGFLTEKLTEKAGEVMAFEVDKKLNSFLDPLEEQNKNLKIVYSDVLSFSWEGYNKIVSNIPYHLAEPIVRKAAESRIDELVIVVGENFKEAIEKDNNKTGILVNSFFEFKPIMFIDPNSFSPKPRVGSWLIKLKRKSKVRKGDRILQSILLRSGKVKNAIVNSLTDEGMTKRQAKEALEKIGFHENVLNKPMASITGKTLLELRKSIKQLRLYSS